MSNCVTNVIRNNVIKILTTFFRRFSSEVLMHRCHKSDLEEYGRARENAYFIKVRQEQLQQLYRKLIEEEKKIAKELYVNEQILKCLAEGGDIKSWKKKFPKFD